jgi:hypothetical protein
LVDGAQAVDVYDLRTILFHSGIPKTSLLTEKAIYDGIEAACKESIYITSIAGFFRIFSYHSEKTAVYKIDNNWGN